MQTIQNQVARLIAKGTKSNAEIAEAIRAKNKGAKTSAGSVAWYKSQMKRARAKTKVKARAKAAASH